MSIQMCPHYLFYVGISILVCPLAAESNAPVDHKYGPCKPKNCGSGPNVSYPFYIYDTEIDFCGHPGFGIFCEEISLSLEHPEITSLKISLMRPNHFGWSTRKWLTPPVLPLNIVLCLIFLPLYSPPSLLILINFIL